MTLPKEQLSRVEKYLNVLAVGEGEIPQPISRIDKYLNYICQNGGLGGSSGNNGSGGTNNNSVNDLGLLEVYPKITHNVSYKDKKYIIAYISAADDYLVVYYDNSDNFNITESSISWAGSMCRCPKTEYPNFSTAGKSIINNKNGSLSLSYLINGNFFTNDEALYNKMMQFSSWNSKGPLLERESVDVIVNRQVGGNSSSVNLYLGVSRQIVINTDTNTIHVMDGTTAGGHALAKLSDIEALSNRLLLLENSLIATRD